MDHSDQSKGASRRVRRSLFILCMGRMDLFRFKKLVPESGMDTISLEGKEKLDEALEAGRGAVILTSHFGSHNIILSVLGFSDYKVNQFATRQTVWKNIPGARQDRLYHRALEIADHLETKLPVHFIYDDEGRRELFTCLERNEILVMGFDGRMGKRWETFPFLGRRARFSTGPLAIASRAGAPMFLSFAVRAMQDNKQRIILEGPWLAGQGSEPWKNILADMVSRLETYVKTYPCHYGEFLRLMRTRRDLDEQPFFERADS